MKKVVLVTSILALLVFSIGGVYIQKSIQTKEGGSYLESSLYVAPKVLYWGSTGQDVKNVQWQLVKWGYFDGKVDGIYGARTYRAVRRFQRKNGLTVDGIVGPETSAALGITLRAGKAAPAAGVSRSDDVYLIGRAVHAEARGEPHIGKVAVAAVILNRVEHPSFPNTIAGVVYQPRAFTAVSDGQINLSPNKDSIRAARDALNGWDPTYGCRYYWNPATATSKWIWSRKVVVKIGKHWFGN